MSDVRAGGASPRPGTSTPVAPEILAAERELLEALLSGYERSVSFGRPAPWKQDVIVRFTQSEFPAAFAATGFEVREALITAAIRLARCGALRLVPIRGRPEREPQEFRLGPAEVTIASSAARSHGLQSLAQIFEEMASLATTLVSSTQPQWAQDLLTALAADLSHGTLTRLGIDKRARLREEQDMWADAVRAFASIVTGVNAYERQFSERLFGDSKRFGAIRARVARLLRDADPQWIGLTLDDIPVEALLLAYDIKYRPVVIQCAGGVEIRRNGHTYALADFWPVAVLPAAWGDDLADGIVAAAAVAPMTITTIENEYAFFQYLDEGRSDALVERREFVIYMGGFPPPVVTRMLARVAAAAPSVRFRHWGDADVGGLRIWLLLRQRIGRPVELFRTTSAWVREQAAARAGQALSGAECRRLQGVDVLLSAEMTRLDQQQGGLSDIAEARRLIAALLKANQKFEQERYSAAYEITQALESAVQAGGDEL